MVLFKNGYAIHPAGIVVQLVRAPPCQGGSCGFEPRQSRTRVQWMEKFIFPFSMKKRGREQDQILIGHPYFTFYFASLIKEGGKAYRNFFHYSRSIKIKKDTHMICGLVEFRILLYLSLWWYHPHLNFLFHSYGIEYRYFTGIHT